MYIVFIFLFLIKTLKSIENLKSDFWCKIIYFFRKRDGFPFKVVNLRKTVLEKNKYIVVK